MREREGVRERELPPGRREPQSCDLTGEKQRLLDTNRESTRGGGGGQSIMKWKYNPANSRWQNYYNNKSCARVERSEHFFLFLLDF